MRPRYSRGKYVKINSYIFGNKTPPLTNLRDRYTSKKAEGNSTQKYVELKTGLEETEIPQGELLHCGDTTNSSNFTNKRRPKFG